VDDLAKLVAIEGVRRVKATYWYAIDTKNWDLLATVFGPDSIADFRAERDLRPGEGIDKLRPVGEALDAGDGAVAQGDAIAPWIASVAQSLATVHHGHAPIIDILGPDDAKAVWPMFDYVDNGTSAMQGYGFYHETYRRDGDRWYIQNLVLTRLRLDGAHPASFANGNGG